MAGREREASRRGRRPARHAVARPGGIDAPPARRSNAATAGGAGLTRASPRRPSFVSSVSSAIGQLLGTPRIHQQAGPPILDDLRHRRGAARHHRPARPPSPRRTRCRSPPARWAGRSSAALHVFYGQPPGARRRRGSDTVSPEPELARAARAGAADSGPCSYDADLRAGIRSRRTAAARSRSSRRLRGYMRATASTAGGPERRRRDGARSGVATPRGRSARAPRRGARRARRRPRGPPTPSSGSAPPRGRRAPCCGAPSAPGRRGARAPAPLVPELVGDDALEAHDEARARACRPRARPQEPVEIDADHDVGARGGEATTPAL